MAPNHHHPSVSLLLLLITASLTLSDPSTSAPSASPPYSSPPSPPPQPPPPSPSPSSPPPSPPPPPPPSPPPPPPPSPPPPPPPSPSPPPPPSPSPPPPPTPSPPPPPPPRRATPQQMNNIVDALIGSGDFGSWVNTITAANPLNLPLSATVFMPENGAVSRAPVADPFLLPYHVVPQRLTFADLRLFKTNSRLPTLLPGKFIVVTCNSESNFTVDGAAITQPDVYVTSNVVVHGVASVLDYSVYGVTAVKSKPKPKPKQQQPSPAPPSPPSQRQSPPPSFSLPLWKSGATTPCLCVQFPVGFMAACAALWLRYRIW